MSRTIMTSTAIAAPAARVWDVLMDFARYPEWNPFVRSIKGTARVGETLEVVIQPPGRKPGTFRPVVIEVQPERSFVWRGSLPIPGLFAGEHRFTLEYAAGGTLFHQSEGFSGLLVPFVGSILDATEAGFQNMNAALKTRAEAG
ncbi:MAG: SRPBCC family protein [Hyphomicrobium sp.]